MSVIRCEGPGCNVQIDTDQDTECVVPDPRHSLAGHPDLIRCTNCRDKMLADHERGDDAASFAADLEAAGYGGIK